MGRNGTLEYARLWAAFGIVFFHAKTPGADVGYAALPFFLILLVVMAAPAAQAKSLPVYLRCKAVRLMLPWLICSVIYGGLKLTEVLITGAPLHSEFNPAMLLSGPAQHLWFLPFAFGVCLLVYFLLGSRSQPLKGPIPSLGFAAAALGFILVQQQITLPDPFKQWIYGMPAVCLALALLSGPAGTVPRAYYMTAFGIIALMAGAIEGLLQLMLAVGLFLLCTGFPRPETPLARQAGAAALGVYLVHPLVLAVLTRTSSLPPQSVAMAVLACLFSLVLILALPQRAMIRPKWSSPFIAATPPSS